MQWPRASLCIYPVGTKDPLLLQSAFLSPSEHHPRRADGSFRQWCCAESAVSGCAFVFKEQTAAYTQIF